MERKPILHLIKILNLKLTQVDAEREEINEFDKNIVGN